MLLDKRIVVICTTCCFLFSCHEFVNAQLGTDREEIDRILQKDDSSSSGSRTTDGGGSSNYILESGHKVEVGFEDDKAVWIRVFGKPMSEKDVTEVLNKAVVNPKFGNRQVWTKNKRLCSVFPTVSANITRTKFVQTGVKRQTQGGQKMNAFLVRRLNGVETGRRYLGSFKTRRYIVNVPLGHNLPYQARLCAKRMVHTFGDPVSAIATYDVSFDSESVAFTDSISIAKPDNFFATALENRAELAENPASPISFNPARGQSIPYDRAFASFVSQGDQKLFAAEQFFKILLAAIDCPNVTLSSLNEYVDAVPKDVLAKKLAANLAKTSDQQKRRRIHVMARIKSKRSIQTLKRLEKDEAVAGLAVKVRRQIEND